MLLRPSPTTKYSPAEITNPCSRFSLFDPTGATVGESSNPAFNYRLRQFVADNISENLSALPDNSATLVQDGWLAEWRRSNGQIISTHMIRKMFANFVYAHRWYLGQKTGVTPTVQDWRDHASRFFPLPHPSWRNTGWLKKTPWFEAELLPQLRRAVKEVL